MDNTAEPVAVADADMDPETAPAFDFDNTNYPYPHSIYTISNYIDWLENTKTRRHIYNKYGYKDGKINANQDQIFPTIWVILRKLRTNETAIRGGVGGRKGEGDSQDVDL